MHPDAYRSPADIIAVAAALHVLDRRRWHGSSSGVSFSENVVENHRSSSSSSDSEPHQPQRHHAAARAGGNSLTSSSDAAVEAAVTSCFSGNGGGGLISIGHGLRRYLSAAPASLLQTSDAGLDAILDALEGRQRQPPAQFYGDLWVEMRSGIRYSGAGVRRIAGYASLEPFSAQIALLALGAMPTPSSHLGPFRHYQHVAWLGTHLWRHSQHVALLALGEMLVPSIRQGPLRIRCRHWSVADCLAAGDAILRAAAAVEEEEEEVGEVEPAAQSSFASQPLPLPLGLAGLDEDDWFGLTLSICEEDADECSPPSSMPDTFSDPRALVWDMGSGSHLPYSPEANEATWELYQAVHVDVFDAVARKIQGQIQAALTPLPRPTASVLPVGYRSNERGSGSNSSGLERPALPMAALLSFARENGLRFPNHAQVWGARGRGGGGITGQSRPAHRCPPHTLRTSGILHLGLPPPSLRAVPAAVCLGLQPEVHWPPGFALYREPAVAAGME